MVELEGIFNRGSSPSGIALTAGGAQVVGDREIKEENQWIGHSNGSARVSVQGSTGQGHQLAVQV